ncbi:winged helix-turn-helix transcriptional regulator [Jannaschia sp. Os4]|uniref:ArsR/SmtB family transcription factor n=1 Tax=Jannaschia sp. Os4 TaxID=2807617 RepID=UPI00193A2F0E|nr:winged helix-turn-helix domain-containing protein [Jannaschia sp. Os4]MBM2577962.1 winged helix-turn-helix transcriptional regulator [Jannaschia sp. Os4]
MSDADRLLLRLRALANPVRLWIVAELHRAEARYVSELARAAGISRPLLKMHLRKLEDAGIVAGEIGTAENGKSANFFRLVPFEETLSPEVIAGAAPTVATGRATDGD